MKSFFYYLSLICIVVSSISFDYGMYSSAYVFGLFTIFNLLCGICDEIEKTNKILRGE